MPAGHICLSGTGRESQFPLSGQLHDSMSPREDRVWIKMREGKTRRGQAASVEKERKMDVHGERWGGGKEEEKQEVGGEKD